MWDVGRGKRRWQARDVRSRSVASPANAGQNTSGPCEDCSAFFYILRLPKDFNYKQSVGGHLPIVGIGSALYNFLRQGEDRRKIVVIGYRDYLSVV